ncbi:MAG: hypothetical protein CMM10_14780 [Rhodospirillaceae bacterium]|nr:hypothetical protein [Rhodospirillaceae bacterium]
MPGFDQLVRVFPALIVVRHPSLTFGKRAHGRFGEQVQARNFRGIVKFVIYVEHANHLPQNDASGTGRRKEKGASVRNFVLSRFKPSRRKIPEIGQRQRSAGSFHRFDETGGKLAAIQIDRPVNADVGQDIGQVELYQLAALGHYISVPIGKYFAT